MDSRWGPAVGTAAQPSMGPQPSSGMDAAWPSAAESSLDAAAVCAGTAGHDCSMAAACRKRDAATAGATVLEILIYIYIYIYICVLPIIYYIIPIDCILVAY